MPFGFDVHSFIFSEDAPCFETELHKRLNGKRINKVNRRKESFSVSLDEVEELVNEIYPSAEFNRTMPAENIGSPCLYLKMPLPSKMMIKQKTMEKIWKNQSRTDGGNNGLT